MSPVTCPVSPPAATPDEIVRPPPEISVQSPPSGPLPWAKLSAAEVGPAAADRDGAGAAEWPHAASDTTSRHPVSKTRITPAAPGLANLTRSLINFGPPRC